MYKLIDCSKCRTPLQLARAAKSIRCGVCYSITVIAPHSSPSLDCHASPFPPPRLNPCHYNQAPCHPHGRKRAVICGVSYMDTDDELLGCINDAKCMKYLLINKFKFPQSSILMLTEEANDPCRWPTKHNIRMALKWLVRDCKPGDSLVFYFSGHGSRKRNHSGDEVDGFDETLCPTDGETHGQIVDNEINATIVRPLPCGVKLHAIIDACHSGTVLDLPFLSRMDKTGMYDWEDHRPRSGKWKGTNGGEAISFSGCDDHQNSEDTLALSKVAYTGAMTYSFIQAIEHGNAATYGELLNVMRSTIRSAENRPDGGIMTSMSYRGGKSGKFKQEPQLTANKRFDVYSKPFFL
ncbi:metacaspase 1 [Euphorbia peplus]|nr:metacaspase 1 [Euphorbia peplus]